MDHHQASAATLRHILLRLARATEGSARAHEAQGGLTPAQAEALRFIAATRPDVATIKHLGRVLAVRHATAVGIVGPLIERGLVMRRPHPYDGRQAVLALTPAGRDTTDRLGTSGDRVTQALDELGPDGLKAIETALSPLINALQRAGAIVVAAPCAGCAHFEPDSRPGAPQPHRCALLRRYLGDVESRMECPEHTPAAVSG